MDAWLTKLVDYLVSQSWQIALLTIVVAFLTFLLRHRSAHTRYLLWLIVLAKCLVPPLYAIPLRVLPQDLPSAWLPGSPTGEVGADTEITAALPYGTQISEGSSTANPVNTSANDTEQVNERVLPALAQESGVRATPHVSRAGKLTWSAARYRLGIIWLMGMGAYLVLNILRALNMQRWLRRERRPLQAGLQAKVAEFFSARGFRRLPEIWIVDDVGQPFVWGLLRGSIYIPADLLNAKSIEQQRSVLGHELGHVVRFDAGVSLLQVLAQGLFWFHPFVWWANRWIRREREKCCDEMAVARLNTPPKDYSRAIVEILTLDGKSSRRLPSLAVVGRANNLEERVRAILRHGKRFHRQPSFLVASAVLLMALLTVPAAFVLSATVGCQRQETPDATGAKEETDSPGDRNVVNQPTESDPNAKIADRFKVSFTKVEYTASISAGRASEDRPEKVTEHFRLRYEIDILKPDLVLGICATATITQFEDDKGKIVKVTDETLSRPASSRFPYMAPHYRPRITAPPAPTGQKEATGSRGPKLDYGLEPSRMTFEFDPNLVGPDCKRIRHLKGHFYALAAESIRYIEVPFEPNETWVRLTPDLEIQVRQARITGNHYDLRIEKREGKRAFDTLLRPGMDLPNQLALRQELIDKDGKPIRPYSGSGFVTAANIGGGGGGSGSDAGRIAKIRFVIAVNPGHHKIPFEFEEIPLPVRPG